MVDDFHVVLDEARRAANNPAQINLDRSIELFKSILEKADNSIKREYGDVLLKRGNPDDLQQAINLFKDLGVERGVF